MNKHRPAFIAFARRTPIGSFQGALSNTSAPSLAARVLEAVLAESKCPPDVVDEVILGCVLTAGLGQAPARQALIGAGLPPEVQALTVNKVCSSGLKAVMLGAESVALGRNEAVLAGGMENMSLAPYLLPKLRSGARLGHAVCEDSLITDGLWDVYNDYHMGNAAELCAREKDISRETQDEYALESYDRALRSISGGYFENEIVPIEVKAGRETVTFAKDEEPGNLKRDKVPNLRPVFDREGTVTAANASTINDGAAGMLVCSEDFLKTYSIKPMAQVVAQGWCGQKPEWFTTAPVGAVRRCLENANWTREQVDLFEINEAFSVVAIACSQELEIPADRLNIRGGAVALGHPVGASGARILTTLLHALEAESLKRGVAAICNGGGEATALAVERVA